MKKKVSEIEKVHEFYHAKWEERMKVWKEAYHHIQGELEMVRHEVRVAHEALKRERQALEEARAVKPWYKRIFA